MPFTKITWYPEVTPHNTAVCEDCGALVPYTEQEKHEAREAKINALLKAAEDEQPLTEVQGEAVKSTVRRTRAVKEATE